MDQRLRLQADLKDNASPKIRQIGKELKEIRRTPGMEAAQKWFTGFSESASGFVKDGGGIASTMGAIGVGGLTAAASMAGLVTQLKALGDHTFQLKRLGQETGLTIEQLRKWEYVGQVFRVPVEQMDGALKTFGDQMVDFRRRRGQLFGELNQLAPQLASKLGTEDTQHQLQDIFNWLGTIKDAAARNRWAKEFFGTDDLSSLLTDGLPALNKAIADANKNVAPQSQDFQEKADQLNKAIVDFNAAWQNFEVNIGPSVFGDLSEAAKEFTAAFADIKAAWDWIQGEKAKPPAEIGKDFGDQEQSWLKRQHEINEQRRREGHGPIVDLPGALLGSGGAGGRGEDGNALRRNDESPLLHRSAFITGLDDRFSGGGLAAGVKEGVLAAFREWAAQSDANRAAQGGGPIKASLETGFGTGAGSGAGGGARGGGAAGTGNANLSGGDAVGEHADYIRSLAQKYGINPRLAVAVAKSEGLGNFVGDHGTSFGDFQLHYGGLADIFERQTGLKANNPANWKQADDWALKYASKNGWGPWHGAARIGVTGRMGIGESSAVGAAAGGGAPGAPGRAVDIAMGLLGAGSSEAARSLGSKMTPGEWCADFVNGAFKAAGMKGVNSSMALAFSNWGRAVGMNDVQKGDVLVENHGGGHGHAGIATGVVKRDRNGNVVAVQMVSGNHGHKVGLGWEYPGEAVIRRAIPSLVDEARKASGQQPGATDGSIEAHVHIHDGQVRGATARSSGSVRPPQVHLRRGPTMTTPNIEA